jgi:hypothetical protein
MPSVLVLVVASVGFSEAPTREERFAGTLVAQADLPSPPPPAVGTPSLVDTAALQAELSQLQATRPALTGPIVLMSVGAGAILLGSVLMAAFWPMIAIVIGIPLVGLGALVGIAGVVLLIVGIAQLPGRIASRHRHDLRVRELETRLAAPAPATSQAPRDLEPGLVLATF